ncbi:hypothetical protein HYX15_03895 [Candidatus Woesearchaeota archaeon]|nr:hypothetical protein [Candidatus Woesearchaeota archaeon]
MSKILNKEIISKMSELRSKNHDLRTIKKKIGEERLKEFFNSIYPKFTITEIENITGIPDSTLGYWFNKLNIPFIRHHIITKAYAGNRDYEIVVTKDGIIYNSATINITPKLAYVIGFALGDGSVQQYMVEVFNKDKKLKEVLFDYLKSYGTITEDTRENGLWRLRLSNGRIANLIKDKNGLRKDTIEFIFSNDELAKNFIAAFWDAEGTVRKQYNFIHIYLYNSDDYLINKVCKFLEFKDITFSILKNKTRNRKYILNGRQVISRKILKRISIPKSSRLKWIKEIGINLNHTTKKEAIEDILKFSGGN